MHTTILKRAIMSNQEKLKEMLQSIINGKEEEAAVSMHDYFVSKTREVAGLSQTAFEELDLSEAEATVHDKIVYHHPGGKDAMDYEDLNGAEVDPDDNTVTVGNRTSLAATHRALEKAGWKKKQVIKGKVGGVSAGDKPYQLGDK